MTELSDAELSNEIYDLVNKHWTLGSELSVAVRTLITAKILAAARISEDEMVEAMADRFMGCPLPPTVCADLCATDSNYKFPRSGTNLLTVNEAQQMFRDALTAIKPTLARLAAENAAIAGKAWQPIETVPRDGTRFLASGGGLNKDVEVCTYNKTVGCWICETCTLDDQDHEPEGYNRPLYWRPLPDTPNIIESRAALGDQP